MFMLYYKNLMRRKVGVMKIFKEYDNNVNAITHLPPHHADEVFATTMLSFIMPVRLFRTRDLDLINDSDALIYDVGFVYDENKKRYDHHQAGFSMKRENGIPYSSAGLIWRKYGVDIVKSLAPAIKNDEGLVLNVVSIVDESLITWIDANDNGQLDVDKCMNVSSLISMFNPLWDEDKSFDDSFIEACEFAQIILKREIEVAISNARSKIIVEDLISKSEGSVIVFDKFVGGWKKTINESSHPNAKKLLYIIFPALDGNWNIQAIPLDGDNLKQQRKPFPEQWCGLNGKQLVDASGIKSAVFCHTDGFFAVAGTKDDAIAFAEASANW